jgi:hypothetical protein
LTTVTADGEKSNIHNVLILYTLTLNGIIPICGLTAVRLVCGFGGKFRRKEFKKRQQLFFDYPRDGDSRCLQNVGNLLSINTAAYTTSVTNHSETIKLLGTETSKR